MEKVPQSKIFVTIAAWGYRERDGNWFVFAFKLVLAESEVQLLLLPLKSATKSVVMLQNKKVKKKKLHR